MKVASYLTLAVAVLAGVDALPAPNAEANPNPFNDGSVMVTGITPEFHELHKRAGFPNAATGVLKGYSGSYRIPRYELRKFVNDKGGFTLNVFLLALQRMQGLSKGNWNSYWEIAGIHGRPFHGWNGEGQGGPGGGYCTHRSTLFPTWHRPYLAYYEQIIWMNAGEVIKQVPAWRGAATKKKWQDTLGHMRLPYWDWATNDGQMPDILTTEYVSVEKPDGSRSTIKNPLFSYNFKSGTYNDGGLFPQDNTMFSRWSRTLRNPSNKNDVNAFSRNGDVQNAMRGNADNLRQLTYQLLTRGDYGNWRWFSHSAADPNEPGAPPNSIEAMHDLVHGIVGGDGGHMQWVEFSAFDPIFFLHHCNIDRIFAIWQALHSDKYVEGQQSGGTFGVQEGWQDANTPLTPFRNAKGEMLTSWSIRDPGSLGYGYEDTPKWNYNNQPTNYKKFVAQRVNQLYGSTNRALSAAAKKRKRTIEVDPNNATSVGIDNSVKNHKYYDWQVEFLSDTLALGGTYTVHVFLGNASTNPEDWKTQKELVGDYVVFTKGKLASFQDPTKTNTIGSGAVPLTQKLIDSFQNTNLTSLFPTDVGDFLKSNLQWRVVGPDGPVPPEDVAGLQITVSASEVTVPDDDEDGTLFPDYGPFVKFPEIINYIGNAGGNGTNVTIPALI